MNTLETQGINQRVENGPHFLSSKHALKPLSKESWLAIIRYVVAKIQGIPVVKRTLQE